MKTKFCILAMVLACGVMAGESAFRLADVTVVYEDALLQRRGPKESWGRCALENLTNVLTLTTGHGIAAVPESKAAAVQGPCIYLGDTQAAKMAGLDVARQMRAEFRMKVEKGRAFLAGNTGMATSYAVTEFLKRFADYRFLVYDGKNPYTVDATRCSEVCDMRAKPAIYNISNSYWSNDYKDKGGLRARWFKGMRAFSLCDELEGKYRASKLPGRCHSQFAYCPPEKYAKDHPEYYALRSDGKRHATPNGDSQLCFSNPEMYKVVYASLVEYIRKDRAASPNDYPLVYDFSQMDNTSYLCKCPECAKLIAKYDRKGGFANGGDAGLQLQFVNRLARDIRKLYPDVMIRTFAYVSTEEPPKDIVPEDNVIIWLCDLYTRCDHMVPLTHPFNAHRLELFRQWKALAKCVEIWDYTLYGDSWSGDFPEAFPRAVQADARVMRDMGLDRVYIENHDENQPFYELNTYLQAELFFNPDQDLETLVRAWCRVYGRGAAAMYRAIMMLQGWEMAYPPANDSEWHLRILPWRTVENWEAFQSIVMDAYSAAEKPEERARIARVLASCLKELCAKYKSLPKKQTAYQKAKTDYLKYAHEALAAESVRKADWKRDTLAVDAFVQLLDMHFADLPAELKNIPETDLLSFEHHTTYAPPSRVKKLQDGVTERDMTMRCQFPADYKLPLGGELSSQGEKAKGFSIMPPDDGKYHWYKVVTGRLGRGGRLNFYTGGPSFLLKRAYVECDGMATDPNWYEYWVSVRRVGNPASTNEKEGIFVDRLVLRRIKK